MSEIVAFLILLSKVIIEIMSNVSYLHIVLFTRKSLLSEINGWSSKIWIHARAEERNNIMYHSFFPNLGLWGSTKKF